MNEDVQNVRISETDTDSPGFLFASMNRALQPIPVKMPVGLMLHRWLSFAELFKNYCKRMILLLGQKNFHSV